MAEGEACLAPTRLVLVEGGDSEGISERVGPTIL